MLVSLKNNILFEVELWWGGSVNFPPMKQYFQFLSCRRTVSESKWQLNHNGLKCKVCKIKIAA